MESKLNISRSAFYQLVKMQNHLNNLRLESHSLSDALQKEVVGSIEILASDIQALTTQYLNEVDRNQIEARIEARMDTEGFWY